MHLVDTTMFYARQAGGVKRYLLAKHAWLTQHTHVQHSMVLPGYRDGESSTGIVTLSSPVIPGTNGYRFPLALNRWRKKLISLSPDLIEAGDPYMPGWAALQAGQHLGIPVVGFYHSDLSRLAGKRLGRVAEVACTRYVKYLYREFDAVLAPSHYIGKKLESLGIENVIRHPLGVDIGLFHPSKRRHDFRQQLGLSADTRLLIFAGRFAREKNIPILLEAFQRLGSPYHLLLVGAGHRIPPQTNVTVYGYQTGGLELARIIASCDALVHAGDQETFGLVALEAFACGLPVVAVNDGAISELVSPATGILVPPQNSSAFAEAIAALYTQDLAQLGLQARSAVEAKYSWKTVMQSLLAIYGQQLAPFKSSLPQAIYATS